MSWTYRARSFLNRGLSVLNLRLESLTASRIERRRLLWLESTGHFERPVAPVPGNFQSGLHREILAEAARHRSRFDDLEDASRNPVGFAFGNGWFESPDAEVLYAVVRLNRPRRIVEIGSGFSTKISRLAILDGGLDTRLVSIDPQPRVDVLAWVDDCHRLPVERLGNQDWWRDLEERDILFVDSSHTVKTGGDVVHLFLRILPRLRAGVLVHIHDVFLPYEYPREWVIDRGWGWNEQYLVQAMLASGEAYEVLWPGHWLQRTEPDFAGFFPRAQSRRASSLWLRCKGGSRR